MYNNNSKQNNSKDDANEYITVDLTPNNVEKLKQTYGEFSLKDIKKVMNGDYGTKKYNMTVDNNTNKLVEKSIHYVEGKKYIVENGKLIEFDSEKHELSLNGDNMPLFCPQCSSLMTIVRDKRAWRLNHSCNKCFIEKRQEDNVKYGSHVSEVLLIKTYQYKIDEITDVLQQIKEEEFDAKKTKQILSKKQLIMNESGELEQWSANFELVEQLVEKLNQELDKLKIAKDELALKLKNEGIEWQ